jgi:hypothetical protein
MSIIRKEQLSNPLSASYALTASYAENAGGGSSNTGSLLTTASVDSNTITFTKGDGSTFPITIDTGSFDTSSLVSTSSFNAFTASINDFTSSINTFTASYSTGSFTGSFTGEFYGTSSWSYNSSQSISSSYALTASYIEGAISVDTGSLLITASSTLNTITFTKGDGSTFPVTIDTGSGGINTGSFVTTSSFNAFTSSYNTGSFTGSFTGSLIGTSSWAYNSISSSYALTASYVNPLHQDVIITGSLFLTQSHISTVEYIDFVTTDGYPHQEGRIHWEDDTKTLEIDTDVNNFMIEVGHQTVVRVRNVTGGILTKGKIVYINGESGNRPTIVTASWDGDPTSASTLGWVAENISNSQTGYVVTNGMLRGINTNAYSPGTQLYLSSSGDYTSIIPISPKHEVRLGKVITQATQGTIYVDVMNGYEIGELHDVLITSQSSGDLIIWNSASRVWVNTKQLTGSYSLTGSLNIISGGLTGSVFGTSSWAGNATNAISSSYALTASYAANAGTGGATSTSASIGLALDGQTSVLTIGQKGYIRIPYNFTIQSWSLIQQPSGSIILDVWKANNTLPTVANTITAGNYISSSISQIYVTSSNITGWTSGGLANDIIGWNLISCSIATSATVQLFVIRNL